MQWVQSRFAQRWNKAHKTFGSVSRDRFWSEVVTLVEEAKEWMEEVFEQVKARLFHKRVKIWSVNERIEKEGRSERFAPIPWNDSFTQASPQALPPLGLLIRAA